MAARSFDRPIRVIDNREPVQATRNQGPQLRSMPLTQPMDAKDPDLLRAYAMRLEQLEERVSAAERKVVSQPDLERLAGRLCELESIVKSRGGSQTMQRTNRLLLERLCSDLRTYVAALLETMELAIAAAETAVGNCHQVAPGEDADAIEAAVQPAIDRASDWLAKLPKPHVSGTTVWREPGEKVDRD